jgi:hypothetical protein
MRETVHIVVDAITKGLREETLAHKLGERVANAVLFARIDQLRGETMDQPETLLRFAKEQHAAIGGEALIP